MSEELSIQETSTLPVAKPPLSPSKILARDELQATALMNIVKRAKLVNNIKGKEYLKLEAWLFLAKFNGCSVREREVTEPTEGNYSAYVDLIDETGNVVGGASALCGTDERTWASRPKNARRSMAITRAAAKACRLAYSPIVTLAGYSATPAEEMSDDVELFNKHDAAYLARLAKYLEAAKYPAEWAERIANLMHEVPITQLRNVVEQVKIDKEVFAS